MGAWPPSPFVAEVADDEEASAVLGVVAGTGGEGLAGADVP